MDEPVNTRLGSTRGPLGAGGAIGAALVFLLGTNLVLTAVAVVADLRLAEAVRLAHAGQIPPLREVTELDRWAHSLHLGQLALIVLTAAVYLAWVSEAVRRAYRRDPEFPHSLGWAQASFFVPFACFYLPAKIANSLVHVANGRVGFARRGLNPVIAAWWTAWVLAIAGGQALRTRESRERPSWQDLEDLAAMVTFSDGCLILAAIFAILMVRQVAGLWLSRPETSPEVA